jgi:uncharacterized glyoxalase superfamily protein PhnB
MDLNSGNPSEKELPVLNSIAPQFLVADLRSAIDYYQHQLGFEQNIAYEDFYASVVRGNTEIHLKRADQLSGERQHRRTNNHVDALIQTTDIDTLFEEIKGRGAEILQPLETQAWGTRDFLVLDSDRHILCFMQDQ